MDKDQLAQDCAAKMWDGDAASKALGIEVTVVRAGEATASMVIREDMVNGLSVCHGGLVFALADTAFAFACNAYNQQSFAASCQIDFLRPGKLGDALTARASEDYRGQRAGYYTVKIENQHGAAVALFRGRSASRDEPMLGDVGAAG